MLENDTLWGGTYLHGLYMGVPPLPPPGKKVGTVLKMVKQKFDNANTCSQWMGSRCGIGRGQANVGNRAFVWEAMFRGR